MVLVRLNRNEVWNLDLFQDRAYKQCDRDAGRDGNEKL